MRKEQVREVGHLWHIPLAPASVCRDKFVSCRYAGRSHLSRNLAAFQPHFTVVMQNTPCQMDSNEYNQLIMQGSCVYGIFFCWSAVLLCILFYVFQLMTLINTVCVLGIVRLNFALILLGFTSLEKHVACLIFTIFLKEFFFV